MDEFEKEYIKILGKINEYVKLFEDLKPEYKKLNDKLWSEMRKIRYYNNFNVSKKFSKKNDEDSELFFSGKYVKEESWDKTKEISEELIDFFKLVKNNFESKVSFSKNKDIHIANSKKTIRRRNIK